jgi:DNA-binding Lrp family transcriptional regulator
MTVRVVTGSMDALDQQLLNEMQDRFPLIKEPFVELAARTDASEAQVIEHLKGMRASGVLRQVSPIFDTKALGYATSLVAMRVPEAKLKAAANVVNAHPGVSHNYKRTHEFNMWFTIAVPRAPICKLTSMRCTAWPAPNQRACCRRSGSSRSVSHST